MNKEKKRALIAMSGGVDSSVAAACLQAEGYDCIGITMRLYDNETAGVASRTCCSLDDVEDARRVCEKLGIDFYVADFKKDFRQEVIEPFIREYEAGRTPNPCIECNRKLKFDRLYGRALDLECDVIATGHYARVIHNPETGEYELHKGEDGRKDQSYVLYMLTHDMLSHIRFPIGEMTKDRTRLMAGEYGFVNADKHDSQDICFIPDGDHQRFLKDNGILCKPGNFITTDGRILGTHKGICNYTCGQRRGLNVPDTHSWYVKEIRPASNEIVLGTDEELFSYELDAKDVVWTLREPHKEGDELKCRARIRYHHREAEARVYVEPHDTVHIVFDEPQRAITPGQAVVLYEGTRVLGGGTII